jgi:hypothetical protein
VNKQEVELNVFENHTEECKAAMAVQNAAIAAAQERLAERIATARSTEDEETMEARSKADAEMDAARAEHDDAVEAAQRVYGATLDHSRDTAWKIIQKRLSIWNGDLPEELPAAARAENAKLVESNKDLLLALEPYIVKAPTTGSSINPPPTEQTK